MWWTHLDSAKALQAVYGADLPVLQDVKIIEISFVNGPDLQCTIRLDLRQLPATMPNKWVARAVNTVQLHLLFLGVEIRCFQFGGSDLAGSLEIKEADDRKEVRLRIGGKEILLFEAKYMFLSEISGYQNGQD